MARSCAAARPRTVPMGRHPGWGSWGPSSEVVCGSKLHTLAPAPLCFVFTGSLPAERRAPRLPPPPPFPRTSPRPQGWSGGVALRRLPLWGKRRLGGGASFPNGGRRLHFRWSSLGREGGGEALPTPLNLGHRRTPASPPPPHPSHATARRHPPPSQWWRSGVPPHPEPCGYRGGRLRVPRHSPPFFLCRCRQWRGRGAVGYGGGGAGPPYATPMQAVCPPPPRALPVFPLCPPAHLPRARRRALPLGRRRGWP